MASATISTPTGEPTGYPAPDDSSSNTTTRVDNDNEKHVEPAGALQASDDENQDRGDPPTLKASVNNVSSIPNGGTKAWLQVLGAHFLFFNSW
jgi:hypothetical protein